MARKMVGFHILIRGSECFMSEKRFYITDRMQITLLPPCIDDWLPESHLARFVAEMVDQLDLNEFYEKYTNRGARA